GLFSISHGWMFFPNTLMMKASLPRQPLALLKNLIGFAPGGGYVGVVGLIRFPYITSFLVACLIGFVLLKRESGTIWRERELFLLLNMGTLLLHMQFARTGWFYRYEAYFITGSILATALALHSRLEGWFVTTWRQPGWYRRVAIAGLPFVTPAYDE